MLLQSNFSPASSCSSQQQCRMSSARVLALLSVVAFLTRFMLLIQAPRHCLYVHMRSTIRYFVHLPLAAVAASCVDRAMHGAYVRRSWASAAKNGGTFRYDIVKVTESMALVMARCASSTDRRKVLFQTNCSARPPTHPISAQYRGLSFLRSITQNFI